MAEGTEPSGQQSLPLRTDDKLEEWIRLVAKAAALELVTRSDIEHLNRRIDDLHRRIDDAHRVVDGLQKWIFRVVVPLSVGAAVAFVAAAGALVFTAVTR